MTATISHDFRQTDWFVYDERTGRSGVRIQGPLDREDQARQLADQLNQFRGANNPGLGWLVCATGAKVTGPFYAVPLRLLSAAELAEAWRVYNA